MSESKILEAVQGRREPRRGALTVAGVASFSMAFLAGQQLFHLIIRSWFVGG